MSETVPDPRDFRAGWILRRTEPDPRDARIAELEAEVARLEALIVDADNLLQDAWPGPVRAEAQRIRSKP